MLRSTINLVEDSQVLPSKSMQYCKSGVRTHFTVSCILPTSFSGLKNRFMKGIFLSLLVVFLAGCSTVSNAINPYYKTPPKEAYAGSRNDHALTGGGSNREQKALTAIMNEPGHSYGANSAAPYKPVIKPAVVRLMWVPDRLNRNGDLIPAHYYYLRILNDRFAIEDAFEVNAALNATTRSVGGGGIPFIYKSR